MNMKEVVCECMGTKAGDIKAAVEAGAVTAEDVMKATGAGTSCGMCVKKIEQIIAKYK